MIKKFVMLAAGLLAGNAMAASATVWSAADGAGTVPPVGGWYAYPTKATSITSATLSAGDDGEKILTAKVSTTVDSSTAGMGFALAKTGATVDLSAYAGVCLTYKSTKAFKFDIKQKSIKDYDYNGIQLPAHSTKQDTAFVAFSKLSQEGWGSEVAFNASLVEGFQFSYKKSIAAEAKSATNTIAISSIVLGSSCTQHAPELTPDYKKYDGNAYPDNILEGKIHEVNVAAAFVDADDDDLVVTVKIESETNAIKLVDSTAYNQNSIIKFTPTANPEGSATITITATDPTKKSATFTFILNTEDTENAPVAKDFSFTVSEDSSYRSPLAQRLTVMGSDADGDKITLVLVDNPAHGTLTVESTGIFIYEPDKDFNGTDSFTYKFVETENPESESDIGTCTITVTPVNDAPVVKVVTKKFEDASGTEHAFGDTLVVDEDFTAFTISIPSSNIVVTDVDGEDDIVISAKSTGVVKAEYVEGTGAYGIKISAIADANGISTVSFVGGDHQVKLPTAICVVKVNPVVDAPVAKNDKYTVYQDSLNKFEAKKGVIVNDPNPDSVAVTAVLLVDASHGKVTLEKDGSFTFDADATYEGEDAFAYALVYGESDTTEMAIVTLEVVYKNRGPAVVAGVIDTVGKRLSDLIEDFTSPKKYTKAEMQTWFVDDTDPIAKITFSARSDDSLTNPSVTSAGVLQVASVKDACGDAEVIVIAKDLQGGTTELKIPAHIKCTNDKPVVKIAVDTVYIPETGWETKKVDLAKLVSDPDGDVLNFTVTDNVNFKRHMGFKVDGDTLTISLLEDASMNNGESYYLNVKAADSSTYVTSKVLFVVGPEPGKDTTGIAPVIASAKMNWQGAIQASRGVVTLMDMQGRVMWTRKLPVSESEVRAAAATVQGRKILRVNKQTFTIK